MQNVDFVHFFYLFFLPGFVCVHKRCHTLLPVSWKSIINISGGGTNSPSLIWPFKRFLTEFDVISSVNSLVRSFFCPHVHVSFGKTPNPRTWTVKKFCVVLLRSNWFCSADGGQSIGQSSALVQTEIRWILMTFQKLGQSWGTCTVLLYFIYIDIFTLIF